MNGICLISFELLQGYLHFRSFYVDTLLCIPYRRYSTVGYSITNYRTVQKDEALKQHQQPVDTIDVFE